MQTPTLPSDRDLFDKTVLVMIFLLMLGMVSFFAFKAVDEKDSSWARETASGIIGALVMKINSDRKPPLGIPEGGSGTSTTVATVPGTQTVTDTTKATTIASP